MPVPWAAPLFGKLVATTCSVSLARSARLILVGSLARFGSLGSLARFGSLGSLARFGSVRSARAFRFARSVRFARAFRFAQASIRRMARSAGSGHLSGTSSGAFRPAARGSKVFSFRQSLPRSVPPKGQSQRACREAKRPTKHQPEPERLQEPERLPGRS